MLKIFPILFFILYQESYGSDLISNSQRKMAFSASTLQQEQFITRLNFDFSFIEPFKITLGIGKRADTTLDLTYGIKSHTFVDDSFYLTTIAENIYTNTENYRLMMKTSEFGIGFGLIAQSLLFVEFSYGIRVLWEETEKRTDTISKFFMFSHLSVGKFF